MSKDSNEPTADVKVTVIGTPRPILPGLAAALTASIRPGILAAFRTLEDIGSRLPVVAAARREHRG